MIAFPNCKINLGLHIINKRADGYHNIETLFYPIALHDVLEIIKPQKAQEDCSIHVYGNEVSGEAKNNLCVKAYHLLKHDFPNLPAVGIHLYKNIPIGAGLGGGSSNGAFMLRLLNNKFNLNIDDEKLMQYALQLGSDCPFFIHNKPAIGYERGEKLHPVHPDLNAYKCLLINPEIHIDTKWAFSQIEIKPHKSNIESIIKQPVDAWKDVLENDFEKPVFANYPEIGKIKNYLYETGAVYASLSGSGSTVFGIFHQTTKINVDFLKKNWLAKEIQF